MALARIKTWIAGETLSASDLNSEFNNIITNPVSLISPLTSGLDIDGNTLTLDAAAATTLVSSAAVSFDFTSGAKSGTPGTKGSVANWAAQTFTDSNTAGSGTATKWFAIAFQRPTLAATNSSVTTTDTATVYIANAPAAGSNQTLTNAYALWIDDGKIRLDPSSDIVSAAGATNDAINITAQTATISGSDNITTATGVNLISVGQPTLSAANALTVTNAATLYISDAPTGAGAGPCTITNAYAIWVGSGKTRLDGAVDISGLLTMSAAAINHATTVTVASATAPAIGAAASNHILMTGTTQIDGFDDIGVGVTRWVEFAGALQLTQGSALQLNNDGENITTAAGDKAMFVQTATSTQVWELFFYTRANGSSLKSPASTATTLGGIFTPRGWIDGCELSPAGSSADLPIGAGQVVDDANATMFNIAALTKTTSAWTVGDSQGGLDTGTIAIDTWYHVWAIRRSDTGVTDYLISLSATSPTMPTNYDEKRRIGSALTDGSSQWQPMVQTGDFFSLGWTPTALTTQSGTATLRTLDGIPTGIIVTAKLNVYVAENSSSFAGVSHWDPAHGSTNPTGDSGRVRHDSSATTGGHSAEIEVVTNTSAQIYNQAQGTIGSYDLTPIGWFDNRGKE